MAASQACAKRAETVLKCTELEESNAELQKMNEHVSTDDEIRMFAKSKYNDDI